MAFTSGHDEKAVWSVSYPRACDYPR